jgi:TP901 family phage tail tape measure protein
MPSAIAEAFVRLRPDVSTFRAESQAGVAGALAGGGGLAGAFSKIGPTAIAATAGVLGFTAATQAAQIALREVVGGAAQFEQAMDVLEVVTQTTGENMDKISNLAKDLGADLELPGTSANDAATALLELSKAGLTVTDSMAGAKGALQLAAAAEIEAAEAAKLIGSALNTFGLQGDQATHVADLLAGASIAAQGEMTDMALALQQVGAVANQAGLSIEQTSGVIALLAKNGILGSDAGTSIRTTLLKLIPTTKEASAAIEALGINIDENATLGEQLPQLVEQYQTQLAKLNPTLRQQALTQIFGTDAIRAASILFEEGALGLADMTDEVNRNGAASELATAKTRGLAGQFDGLKSQLSSLAVEIGEVVNPVLAEFVATANSMLSPIISITRAVKDLSGAFLDLDIPGTDFGLKDAFNIGRDISDLATPGKGAVKAFEFVKGKVQDTKEEVKDLREEMTKAGTFVGSPDIVDRGAAITAAREAGRPVGNQFGQSVAEGIAASKPAALSAAEATVRDVAAQGRAAIAAAIAGAQQNLSSLGSSLASDAGAIIDATVEQGLKSVGSSGGAAQSAGQRARQQKAIQRAQAELDLAIANVPIQREIERLQAQLDRESGRDAATDVRRGLRDAKEELAAAQKQLQSTGTTDPGMQARNSKFLRPFQEAVQDAQGEVKKFNLEGRLDKLQKRLDDQTDDIAENIESLRENLESAREALIQSQQSFSTGGVAASLKDAGQKQKEAVTRGINDAIQAFNDGLITLPQLNKRLAKVLEDNGVDYEKAGAVLGTAFMRGWEEKIKGIVKQAEAIKGGPFDPGAGIRATVISPGEVSRVARLNNEQAARELLLEQKEANGWLEQIARAVAGETVKPNPRPTGAESAAEKGYGAIPSTPGRRRSPRPEPDQPFVPTRRSGV